MMKVTQFFEKKTTVLFVITMLMLPSLATANQVIESQGPVTVKRAGASSSRAVKVGTRLKPGDVLYPATNARVVVQCGDGALWQVTPGIPSGVESNCPPLDTSVVRSGFADKAARQDEKFPYLISPRYTRLQDAHPTLRWNSVVGAKQYTVELLANTGVHWSTTTEATEIKYPEDAPPLLENINYLLIVKTDNGVSSLGQPGGVLGFSLLSSSTIQQVQDEIAKALKNVVNSTTQALIKAEIYQKYGLFQDGIDILKEEIGQNRYLDDNQQALVYSRLGDLYNQVGLTGLAETNFTKAVTIFKKTENEQALADALLGLAVAQWLQGKNDQAQQSDNQALQIYQAQGLPLEEEKNILFKAKTHQPPPIPLDVYCKRDDSKYKCDYIDLGNAIEVP